jgi:hypothetical protein
MFHVSFDELQVKVFSKSTILRNVLIDIPVQFSELLMDDGKTTVLLNGTVVKKKFM